MSREPSGLHVEEVGRDGPGWDGMRWDGRSPAFKPEGARLFFKLPPSKSNLSLGQGLGCRFSGIAARHPLGNFPWAW